MSEGVGVQMWIRLLDKWEVYTWWPPALTLTLPLPHKHVCVCCNTTYSEPYMHILVCVPDDQIHLKNCLAS